VSARAAEEEGFGLIELLFAMVMLNIGILALVAAFQSGAVALARSSSTSNGAAVADKVMEVFRGLKSCQIYLSAPAGGGADVSGLPNGIPSSTSSWYARYSGDPGAYSNLTYFNYNGSTPLWVTSPAGSGSYAGIPAPCAEPTLPSGSPDPTKAVQYVSGPDGQNYPVFTYIVALQPKDTAGNVTAGWLKQVTVTVWNPRSTAQMLARETSYFDPNVTG
jgi:type II secretory pathway pseudopilin PulG